MPEPNDDNEDFMFLGLIFVAVGVVLQLIGAIARMLD